MVESSSTLPRYGRRPYHVVSSALRHRHNKTVHFGDNLEPNVQQLFSFIETVLSAWVLDEDGDDRRRTSRSLQQPKRTPSDVVALLGKNLHGDRNIGCSRYKHDHWRITPERCNAIFLSKVNIHKKICRALCRLCNTSTEADAQTEFIMGHSLFRLRNSKE
jgi:hypothetical protein